jgi:hypothetical protein
VRQFPAVVAAEVLLALLLLFVAPFLHGSARNQAFQADAAKHATAPIKKFPKPPTKEASASTWVEGTAETVAVPAIMIGSYRYSGRLTRCRAGSVADSSAGSVAASSARAAADPSAGFAVATTPSAHVVDGAPVASGASPATAPTSVPSDAPTPLDAPTEPAAR